MEMEAPRRSRGCDASRDSCPEFEFWMVGNRPGHEPGSQLTADELFVDGVLLPLHLLSFANSEPEPKPEPEPEPEPEGGPKPLLPPTLAPCGERATEEPSSSITSAPTTCSRRWKDIFKKSSSSAEEKEKEKSGKKERKASSSSGGGGGGAELNINIWPFSRSRSAGTAGGRPKTAAAAMGKSSSAPCSRSNSRGERRWAASPGRAGGVHVGRVSPVWQVRRGGGGRPAAETKAGPRRKAGGAGGGAGRGLNLAPLNGCIGYRSQSSCRGDEAAAAVGGGGGGGANGSLFRLRGLFTKKVY